MIEGSTDAFMPLEPFLAASGDGTREQRNAAHQVELDRRHCTWLRDVSGGTVSRECRMSLTPEGRAWLGKARGELTSLRARHYSLIARWWTTGSLPVSVRWSSL